MDKKMEMDGIQKDDGVTSSAGGTRSISSMWNTIQDRVLKNKRRSMLIGAVALVLIILIAIFAGGASSSNLPPNSYAKFDCNSIVADARYFQNVVTDLSQNAYKRCKDGQTDCACPDPAVAARDDDYPAWRKVVKHNHELLQTLFLDTGDRLDLLLVGSDVMEHWLGTHDAEDAHDLYGDIHEIFLHYFQPPEGRFHRGPAVHGFALGVGNDGYSAINYRMQNGSLKVDVPVIWVMMGAKDLVLRECTDHAVIAGWMSLIETIRSVRGDKPTRIVINSLLPMEGYEQEVRETNERLHCFAKQTEGVDFFDATPIFAMDDLETPNKDLFADDFYPNAKGYELWGEAIVVQTYHILKRELKLI